MKILNPTPINPTSFNNMFVANMLLTLPTDISNGQMFATILPYNGEHLLATGGKRLTILNLKDSMEKDASLATMVTNIVAEAKRQANSTSTVSRISVYAPDPTIPVRVVVQFEDTPKPFMINDCFTLASTDAQFGTIFLSAMAEVATRAGLSVNQ